MANKWLDVKEIARPALVRLIENLVFPNLVYKDYSTQFELGKGAKVQVKKPVVLQAEEFDSTAGITTQDIDDSNSVEVTLDKIATVDIEVGALEGAVSFDDVNRLFIEPAAVALAQKINSDGLLLYKDIPYIGGTAGTTLTGKLVYGDVLQIGNYFYAVTADTAGADTKAIASVPIYPAAKEAIADNAVMTLIGSHTANLAVDTGALKDSIMPYGS